MAGVQPLNRADLPDLEDGFALVEAVMGFVPNSMLTMARVPGLSEAFGALGGAIFSSPLIGRDLQQMVAFVSSNAAGCRYCQTHTAHTAHRGGVSDEKLAALWEFETSDEFDEAERAALRLAFHAGQVPNATTEADFEACREHYSDEQITAIVAVISMFGYLNRWNDTMGTTLETMPTEFGNRVLTDGGWSPGKHAETTR